MLDFAPRLTRALGASPVRLALALLAVFTLVNLAALGAAYGTLRQARLAGIEADLAREIAALDLSLPPAALMQVVAQRAEVSDPAETALVFVDLRRRVNGNVSAVLRGAEVELRPNPGQPPLAAAGYLTDVQRLSGGVLIAGKSLAPLAALRDTFVALTLLSVLPTVLVSLGLAALLARRAARRVREVEAVLDQLSTGALDARVTGAAARGSDDVSRIGARVNHMAQRQEAAMSALRQVSADIAHDLRTPLQRISVALDALSVHLPENSPAAAYAEIARTEAARTSAIFAGLLQIARLEGGTGLTDKEMHDLSSIAREVHALLELVAEESGHVLLLDAPAAHRLPVSRDLVMQALSNLVENALTHTPAGTEITIGTGPDGFTVRDTGPGIPQSEQEAVTRRLYRLERSRSTPGSGLGLAIAKAVAQAHGGALELQDAAPGLEVFLRLR